MDREESLKIIRMIANGEDPFEGEKPAEYLPEHNPKTLRALCKAIASLFPIEQDGDVISNRQPMVLGNYLNKPIEQFVKKLEKNAILDALKECLLQENRAAEMLGISNAELQSKILEHNIDLSALEKKAIFQALFNAEWNIEKAAELLSIDLNRLENKIDEIDIGREIITKVLLTTVTSEYEKAVGLFKLDPMLKKIEKNAIIKALKKSNHNKNKAAGKLKVSFRSLRYRIDKLRLEESDVVDPTMEIDYFKFYIDLSLNEFLKIVEKRFIKLALEELNYNYNRSAEKLGITFRSLRYRIDNLGIKTP